MKGKIVIRNAHGQLSTVEHAQVHKSRAARAYTLKCVCDREHVPFVLYTYL